MKPSDGGTIAGVAEDQFKESREGTLTIKLTGPMGIGKTTLAFYIKKCLEDAGAKNVTLDLDLPSAKYKVDVAHFVEEQMLNVRPDRKIVIEDRWERTK